jgi:hypothetical protein
MCIPALALLLMSQTAESEELLSYQGAGWKYLQTDYDDPVGQGFFVPGFDDSGWPLGQAAFGAGACDLMSTVATYWAPDTDLLLRRTFFAAAAEPLTLFWAVDNDAVIWVNGTQVADVIHENCPVLDEFSVVVPPAVLVDGANLLTVRARDRGAYTFFDLRIDGTPAPVSVDDQSWAKTKDQYRTAR